MRRSEFDYSTECYTLRLKSGEPYFYVNWKGFLLKQSVFDGCELIFQSMCESKTFNILNDNTNVKGLWDYKWVAENWFPRMIEAGLQKFAWVKSPEHLSAELAEKTLHAADECECIKIFPNREAAVAWLTNSLNPSAIAAINS